MMRNGLVACVAILVNGCFAGDCVLPKIAGQINWDMLHGQWYQVINAHDPIDSMVHCYVLENIRGEENGGCYFDVKVFTNQTSTDPYATLPLSWRKLNDGAYICKPKYEQTWFNALGSLPKASIAGFRKEMKGGNSLFHDRKTFLTDYENYILIMSCTGDGKYVWVFGSHGHATESDINMARDTLAEIGNGWEEVPLYPSGCSKFQFPDHAV